MSSIALEHPTPQKGSCGLSAAFLRDFRLAVLNPGVSYDAPI
jgi:hypothetical protein